MEIVVDTNCIISALIKNSKSRAIVCSPKLHLCAPEHMISEIENNKEEIIEKAGMSEYDFELLIAILLSNIEVVPMEKFYHFRERASSLAKHPEDAEFLALALLRNIPLWSDDKDLKKQNDVKVLNTPELLELVKNHLYSGK